VLRCPPDGDAQRSYSGTVALVMFGAWEMPVCSGARSDGLGEFVERGGDPEMTVSSVDAELVVAATQVLHERVTPNDHPRSRVGLQSAHRSQPRFESPVAHSTRLFAYCSVLWNPQVETRR
jgi:hypothetical protein